MSSERSERMGEIAWDDVIRLARERVREGGTSFAEDLAQAREEMREERRRLEAAFEEAIAESNRILREEELRTPVSVEVGEGWSMEIPRLIFEEIGDGIGRDASDFDMIEAVLKPLLREGLIKLGDFVPRARGSE